MPVSLESNNYRATIGGIAHSGLLPRNRILITFKKAIVKRRGNSSLNKYKTGDRWSDRPLHIHILGGWRNSHKLTNSSKISQPLGKAEKRKIFIVFSLEARKWSKCKILKPRKPPSPRTHLGGKASGHHHPPNCGPVGIETFGTTQTKDTQTRAENVMNKWTTHRYSDTHTDTNTYTYIYIFTYRWPSSSLGGARRNT